MILGRARTVAIVFLLAVGACGERGDTGPAEGAGQTRIDRTALLTASCSGCHAVGGEAIADLGGLDRTEIVDSLNRYRSEPDGVTVMHRLARGYSDADVAAIAAGIAARRSE